MKINQDIAMLAKELGWQPLRKYGRTMPGGVHFTWYDCGGTYETGLLQINLLPCVSACVFAFDFEVCSGWYPLELPLKEELLPQIKDWLHFDHFRNQDAIDRYVAMHPECAHHTWDAQATLGPPYGIQWVESENGRGSYQRSPRSPR
ncbi:MAG: hypothetical protein ACO1RA_10435 [Planctomycetaceae bacterium]